MSYQGADIYITGLWPDTDRLHERNKIATTPLTLARIPEHLRTPGTTKESPFDFINIKPAGFGKPGRTELSGGHCDAHLQRPGDQRKETVMILHPQGAMEGELSTCGGPRALEARTIRSHFTG